MGIFDKFKNRKVINSPNLICAPSDPGSYKCIFLAAYRRFPLDIEWEKSLDFKTRMSNSLGMSDYIRFPCVVDGDFAVCGVKAVLTYLNIKGMAPSLRPRKAKHLAMQQYWIQVAKSKLEPLISDFSNNDREIASILDAMDRNLMDKTFVIGEWSLADIHWSGIAKCLEINGHNDVFINRQNLKCWLDRVKSEIPVYETDFQRLAA